MRWIGLVRRSEARCRRPGGPCPAADRAHPGPGGFWRSAAPALALLLGLAGAAPAAAAGPSTPQLQRAMAFVSAQTGLPIPAQPPRIRLMSIDHIQQLDGRGAMAHARVVGFYDAGVIGLIDVWDGSRTDDQAVLIHELTHYMQDRAGLRLGCAGAYEAQAYAVQRAWLASRGLRLRDVGVPPQLLARTTACERPGRLPAP